MYIYHTKLQYCIENQLLLEQDRISNICTVSIVVPKRMQGMRHKLLTILTSYIKPYIHFKT